MAGALRVGGSRRCVWVAFDGGGSGGDGAGRCGDVERRGGAAGVLREAKEDFGGGGEEDHEGDF